MWRVGDTIQFLTASINDSCLLQLLQWSLPNGVFPLPSFVLHLLIGILSIFLLYDWADTCIFFHISFFLTWMGAYYGYSFALSFFFTYHNVLEFTAYQFIDIFLILFLYLQVVLHCVEHRWQTQGPWAESCPCFIRPSTLFLPGSSTKLLAPS